MLVCDSAEVVEGIIDQLEEHNDHQMTIRIAERELHVGGHGDAYSAEECKRVKDLMNRHDVVAACVVTDNWDYVCVGGGVIGIAPREFRVRIMPVIEKYRLDSNWHGNAMAMESGLWRGFCQRFWQADEEVLMASLSELLRNGDSGLLARDIVGWWTRTVDQPLEARAGEMNNKFFGFRITTQDLRMFSLTVFAKLVGVPVWSFSSAWGSLEHGEFARKLWVLSQTLREFDSW